MCSCANGRSGRPSCEIFVVGTSRLAHGCVQKITSQIFFCCLGPSPTVRACGSSRLPNQAAFHEYAQCRSDLLVCRTKHTFAWLGRLEQKLNLFRRLQFSLFFLSGVHGYVTKWRYGSERAMWNESVGSLGDFLRVFGHLSTIVCALCDKGLLDENSRRTGDGTKLNRLAAIVCAV